MKWGCDRRESLAAAGVSAALPAAELMPANTPATGATAASASRADKAES